MDSVKFEIIDGIKCYSPDLAIENNGFQSEGFDFLFDVESNNFWFKSRNRVITHLFEKHLGTGQKSILEIGCGTGFVLSALSGFKNYCLTGAEIYIKGLKYAQRRLKGVEFVQLDATRLPLESQYDAIGAFDVLEHIKEDELVMKNVFKALKNGGKFFVSVPQYWFMWSVVDDISCHKRRYSRKELTKKIKSSGFTIEYAGSFATALFPIMYISRLFQKLKGKERKVSSGNHNELELNPIINKIFGAFTKIDEVFIKKGISLPFGGSLILVARK